MSELVISSASWTLVGLMNALRVPEVVADRSEGGGDHWFLNHLALRLPEKGQLVLNSGHLGNTRGYEHAALGGCLLGCLPTGLSQLMNCCFCYWVQVTRKVTFLAAAVKGIVGTTVLISTIVIFSVTSTLGGDWKQEFNLPSTWGQDWTVVTMVPSDIMVHLLGRCDTRARSGRSGYTQVLKGALLIVKLCCHGGCWAQGFP